MFSVLSSDFVETAAVECDTIPGLDRNNDRPGAQVPHFIAS